MSKSQVTRFDGKSLTSKIDTRGAGVAEEYFYWVGITSECPGNSIDIAGVNFPKVNELIVPDPMGGSKKRRIPVSGAIVKLSERKLRALVERLPRTVIRFYDDKQPDPEAALEEPNTGKNVGDAYVRPRRGYPITVPTREEVEARRKAGKATQEYRPTKRDEPAARYMFMHLCRDQVKGSRGESYVPIAEAGIEWPGSVEDNVAKLFE